MSTQLVLDETIRTIVREELKKSGLTNFNDELDAKDLMKLLFFNDPIPSLHTHSYGFNTATGRAIIES